MKTKNTTLKILTIVGARPQFIKAAALSQMFSKNSDIEEIILHTGQHFDLDMSEIFFNELQIPKPAYNLNINGGTHGQMTGKMLEGIETIILQEKPNIMLVYGDTNSTVAGALAAAKLHVPVCHVESGLRSFNKLMPEEINRVVTDHLSTLLFCPTTLSVNNLNREGITNGIHHVGDVMYDIVLQISSIAKKKSNILQRLGLQEKKYALATIHRAENTDCAQKLQKIIDFLNLEAETQNLDLVLPLHPRTKAFVKEHDIYFNRIQVCDPLGYLDMQRLLQEAKLVLTDSGGLQKEAYFHQVPCVTLRDETEWMETIEFGWNRLWGVSDYASPRATIPDYGVGKASETITRTLLDWFKRSQ